MVAKIKTVALLCLALLPTAAQSLPHQDDIFNKFAGTYVAGSGFSGSSLRLNADGRFSKEWGNDEGKETTTTGTCILSEGVLRFRIEKSVGRSVFEGREFNLLDPQESKELFGYGGSGEVEREFRMVPVEWSGRMYLIYEDGLKDFANAVNLGLEPRSKLSSDPFCPSYGSFYLRDGDERKKITGNPAIPDQWRSFILSKPVVATIISIQEDGREKHMTRTVATINKGRKDGLRVGMRLLVKGEEPYSWDGTEVISVEEKRAKIRTVQNSGLKTGDKLTTRYEPKEHCRQGAT